VHPLAATGLAFGCGELKTAHLAIHPMPLDEGPRGYDLFKNKKDPG
jgi:hypothetical protein